MAAPDLSRSGVDALESASAGRIARPTMPFKLSLNCARYKKHPGTMT